MHPILHSVSVAHDALDEKRPGFMERAFSILGPGGEAFVEFEHHYRFGNSIGLLRPSVVRENTRRDYEYENNLDCEQQAQEHDPPVGTFEYDAFIAGVQRDDVERWKTTFRNRINDIERREWRDPPRAARLYNFDAVLKERYTDDKITDLTFVDNPFVKLIKKDPDAIECRLKSYANYINYDHTATITGDE